jgi:hypothetical protein
MTDIPGIRCDGKDPVRVQQKEPVMDTIHASPPVASPDPRPGVAAPSIAARQPEGPKSLRSGFRSSGPDLETIGSIRALERDFRRDLQGVLRDDSIDRRQVLEGMIEALRDLTAGLRELSDRDHAVTDRPARPGSLVDLTG